MLTEGSKRCMCLRALYVQVTSCFSTTSHATCSPSKPLKGTSLVSISHNTWGQNTHITHSLQVSVLSDTFLIATRKCRCLIPGFIDIYTLLPTHHTIGVSVTGLRDRQALNNFRSHPRKSANHRHMGGVRQELRRSKITNLVIKVQTQKKYCLKKHYTPAVFQIFYKMKHTTIATNLQDFVHCHYHCKQRIQKPIITLNNK